MFFLLLTALVVQGDTVYATPGLRELVARAAEANREVPADLESYLADVFSEVDFVIHTPDGEELSGQVEQFAARVSWWRDGVFRQHVVGHRVQAAGPNVSISTYQRQGWIVPVLYGQRLLFDYQRTSSERPQRTGFQTVHPFSDDRDRVYSFRGGDTVAVLQLAERAVRIARIQVTPREGPHTRRMIVLHGEIDLDADRHQIVRMRGRLVLVGPERGVAARLLSVAVQGWPYIELENAEYEGRYWLPARQRVEYQATTPLTDSRAVIRIVSRFADLRANAPLSDSDRPAARTARLTFAAPDTLRRYDGWAAPIGAMTGGMRATDFADVAPVAWRPYGPPHVRFAARRFGDIMRYNRVEGVYTGAAGVLFFRDAVPGLELRGVIGHAWSEQAVRGSVELQYDRAAWTMAVRAARDLQHTNDFEVPFANGFAPSAPLLFGTRDPFDYVDRRGGTATVTRWFRRADLSLAADVGWLHDRPVQRNLLRGMRGGDTLRLNRPVEDGGYLLQRVTLTRGRSVNSGSLRPGLGSRLVFERAQGTLEWSRIEARLQLRGTRGPFGTALRLEAGTVLGERLPPQVLYELGTTNGLPGHPYKAFGGDRAALGRALLMYDPHLLDAPIRFGNLVVPGLSPALAGQLHAGWTDVSRNAEAVLATLGSRASDGVRSSVDLQVVFFGGMFGFGVARALERGDTWQFIASVGGIH